MKYIKNLDRVYKYIYNMQSSQTSHIENHVLKKFNVLKKVGSGAYGHVWKVEDRITKKVYALKKIFDAFQHATDAQRTYRQIQILKQTDHPNIIKLFETIKADNNKDVYLVFQFMQADLHNVIAEGILKDVHIKFIIYQLAKALKYLHSGFLIHRDLKPSNILINSNCSIKLCDFGLVRSLASVDLNGPVLTEGVATRWYRAPEVLLGSKSYSTPADIWSFACIIFQILAQKPLFPGNSTVDQIDKILAFTGYPSDEDVKSLQSDVAKSMLKQSKVTYSTSQFKTILKDFPPQFIDLLQRMLTFNPHKRITIQQILSHEVVRQFRKVQQQTVCSKQIKMSIDDNKKLTVEEYRNLIYGARTLTKTISSSSLQMKTIQPYKKSNSYSKLASNVSLTQKDPKAQKQIGLKYSKSTKDIVKSLHAYNRISEVASNGNQAINKPKYQNYSGNKEISKDIGGKNIYATKSYIHQKYGDYRHVAATNQISDIASQVSSITSPKYISAKSPLIKSSKYVVNKTQQSANDK